jgi:penicillin-binding protein 1C
LRQIFANLRMAAPYAGLWHSPALRAVETCEWIGPPPCVRRQDWSLPSGSGALAESAPSRAKPAIARPLQGEMLAIDPRTPRASQQFHFALDSNGLAIRRVVWRVDGSPLAGTHGDSASWELAPGAHRVSARVWVEGRDAPFALAPIPFSVLGNPSLEDD